MTDTEISMPRGVGRPPKEQPKIIIQQMPSAEDVARKPTHDARIQYYKVLEYILLTMKYNCLTGNYAGWYRGLRQFHIMIIGYVKANTLIGIKEKFLEARQQLDMYDASSGYRDRAVRASMPVKVLRLDDLFFSIEEQLHVASKDMMLPTGGLSDGDLDMESLLRNSGL